MKIMKSNVGSVMSQCVRSIQALGFNSKAQGSTVRINK